MGHLLGRNTWGPPAGCWCPGVVGVAVDGNACDGSRGRQEREDEKEDVDEKGGTERRGRSATSQRRSSRLSLLPPASSLHMNVRVGNPCSLDVNKSVAAPSGVAFSRQRTNERTNERKGTGDTQTKSSRGVFSASRATVPRLAPVPILFWAARTRFANVAHLSRGRRNTRCARPWRGAGGLAGRTRVQPARSARRSPARRRPARWEGTPRRLPPREIQGPDARRRPGDSSVPFGYVLVFGQSTW